MLFSTTEVLFSREVLFSGTNKSSLFSAFSKKKLKLFYSASRELGLY